MRKTVLGLSAIGNFQRVLAVHGGHSNLRAHGGLRHRDRNHAVQVVAFAREEGMLLHVQHDIQISGRTAEGADFSRAGKANSRSVFHARGNFGVYGALAKNAAFAFALRAGIGDDAARALASGTGASDAEESLLVANLAAAVAGAASRRPLARRRTGAAAVFASFVAANRDLRLRAEECLLELEGQVFAKIGAALNAAAAASAAAAATEHVAEAEELAEDVAEVLEDGGIEARGLPRAAAEAGVAVAVVGGALVGVGEHGIGFADFLEFFFRVGIVGIAVGMKLQRELAIGALELDFGDRAAHAQHFVVIAFCVRGQNKPFFKIKNLGKLGPRWPDGLAPYRTLQGFFATFTIAGRSRRSLIL